MKVMIEKIKLQITIKVKQLNVNSYFIKNKQEGHRDLNFVCHKYIQFFSTAKEALNLLTTFICSS